MGNQIQISGNNIPQEATEALTKIMAKYGIINAAGKVVDVEAITPRQWRNIQKQVKAFNLPDFEIELETPISVDFIIERVPYSFWDGVWCADYTKRTYEILEITTATINWRFNDLMLKFGREFHCSLPYTKLSDFVARHRALINTYQETGYYYAG